MLLHFVQIPTFTASSKLCTHINKMISNTYIIPSRLLFSTMQHWEGTFHILVLQSLLFSSWVDTNPCCSCQPVVLSFEKRNVMHHSISKVNILQTKTHLGIQTNGGITHIGSITITSLRTPNILGRTPKQLSHCPVIGIRCSLPRRCLECLFPIGHDGRYRRFVSHHHTLVVIDTVIVRSGGDIVAIIVLGHGFSESDSLGFERVAPFDGGVGASVLNLILFACGVVVFDPVGLTCVGGLEGSEMRIVGGGGLVLVDCR